MRIYSFDIGVHNFAFYSEVNSCPEILENVNLNPYCFEKLKHTLGLYLNNPDIVLIEQQLHQNSKSKVVQNHLEAYIKLIYPNCKVIFVNSKNKFFIRKPEKNYKDRKQCAVLSAQWYLGQKSINLLEKLNSYKKKDDMADAVCQLIKFTDTHLQT